MTDLRLPCPLTSRSCTVRGGKWADQSAVQGAVRNQRRPGFQVDSQLRRGGGIECGDGAYVCILYGFLLNSDVAFYFTVFYMCVVDIVAVIASISADCSTALSLCSRGGGGASS